MAVVLEELLRRIVPAAPDCRHDKAHRRVALLCSG